jgi:GrpB-like predicted nucleotidyltransferase (UPF0157 family)
VRTIKVISHIIKTEDLGQFNAQVLEVGASPKDKEAILPRRITVVPYDPTWKSEFQEETGQISRALGENVLAIHHIGSTAIPGIHAKPIIDILLRVADINLLDEQRSAMEQLGYEVMGEYGIKGRRYFRKDDDSGTRTHHVHAFETGNPEYERHLVFRDYMIAHPEKAQQYSTLKQKLARAHPDDIEAYMDGKDPFIKEHEVKATDWMSLKNAK